MTSLTCTNSFICSTLSLNLICNNTVKIAVLHHRICPTPICRTFILWQILSDINLMRVQYNNSFFFYIYFYFWHLKLQKGIERDECVIITTLSNHWLFHNCVIRLLLLLFFFFFVRILLIIFNKTVLVHFKTKIFTIDQNPIAKPTVLKNLSFFKWNSFCFYLNILVFKKAISMYSDI